MPAAGVSSPQPAETAYWAAKTIHLLDYCNDRPFRRRVLTQLNRGETATRSRATSVTTTANCASATAKARKNSSACSA